MSRKRVLFVHHRPELGGAPTSLALLIRGLDRSEYEPHVLVPEGPAAELFAESAEVHTAAVASFTHIWASTYRGLRWGLLARETARLPAHVRALQRLLRQRFDLVHLNDSPLVPAALLAHRKGVPIVWHLRSALPGDDVRSRMVRSLVRRVAAASIAINSDVALSFGGSTAVIPNPVDVDGFARLTRDDARRMVSLGEGDRAVAFFGFIYASKGLEELIDAVGRLSSEDASRLFLVGAPTRPSSFYASVRGRLLVRLGVAVDENARLEAAIARAAVADRVVLTGYVPDPTPYYRAADVVVAPSRGPELGRPVLEGAAAGVPVVATGSTTGGGVILPGETGVLVPPGDAAALADAIGSLLRDEPRRQAMGAAAETFAAREFSIERHVERVEQVYRDVLTRAAG